MKAEVAADAVVEVAPSPPLVGVCSSPSNRTPLRVRRGLLRSQLVSLLPLLLHLHMHLHQHNDHDKG